MVRDVFTKFGPLKTSAHRLVALLTVLATSSACTLIADIDRQDIPPEEGVNPMGTQGDTMTMPSTSATEVDSGSGGAPSDSVAPGGDGDAAAADAAVGDAAVNDSGADASTSDAAAPATDASVTDAPVTDTAVASDAATAALLDAAAVTPSDAAAPDAN
jgi:hypothetical protein